MKLPNNPSNVDWNLQNGQTDKTSKDIGSQNTTTQNQSHAQQQI